MPWDNFVNVGGIYVEILLFLPGPNITCFMFYIHLWPIYWLSLVLRNAMANNAFAARTTRPRVGVYLEAAFSTRSSTRPYTWVTTTECQQEIPWRGSMQPSNEVYEDRGRDDPNKMALMHCERFDYLLTILYFIALIVQGTPSWKEMNFTT
jgi:hypothetical protein